MRRLFHFRVTSPHNADEVALFAALPLDDAGHPVPVVHSDFAFALVFGAPAPERMEPEPGSTGQCFPAALVTIVGILDLVDLPEFSRAPLRDVESTLWRAIQAARDVADSELCRWNRADAREVPHPFGSRSATADEFNAARLWSCVYIAVRPPRESTS